MASREIQRNIGVLPVSPHVAGLAQFRAAGGNLKQLARIARTKLWLHLGNAAMLGLERYVCGLKSLQTREVNCLLRVPRMP